MSKNLTRKGLAFGALVALGASVIAGAPANAAGLADKTFVSLTPNIGTEYSVLSNGTFDLKSNIASSVAGGGEVKFLVSDSTSKSRALVAATGVAASAAFGDVTVPSADLFRYTKTHSFLAGDFVTIDGTSLAAGAGTTGTVVVKAVSTTASFDYSETTPTSAVATAGSFTAVATAATAVSRAQILAASTSFAERAALGGSLAGTIAGTATDTNTKRATDGSYVVSSRQNTNGADKVIRLVNIDATASLSIEVTSWVDSNGNNAIDDTESTSPTRTVKFLKDSDITTTTVLKTASVGDATLGATITTTPVLNGDQVGDSAGVSADFTRQGSTATIQAATTTWSDTTKTWTATSTNLAATAGAWTGLTTPTARTGSDNLDGVTVSAAGLVSVTTDAVHNLLTGDKVTFVVDGADDDATEIASAVTTAARTVTVTGTKTFTFVTDNATITAGSITAPAAVAASNVTGYSIQTYGATVGLADRALSGTNTVKAKLGSTGSFVAVGSATSGGAKARTAATINPEVLVSANTVWTAATTSEVRKGTTEATVVVTITDSLGAAVAAGVNAVATVSAPSGTFKVNGTTVANASTVSALTDANGQALFVVTNAAALVDNAITLTVASEGVTGVAETLTWKDSIYTVLDLNDQTTAGSARNRAVADKATYTFNFLVQDQFKAVAPASLRLLVTVSGNTGSTQTVDLVAGKASFAVADGGLTAGDAIVAIEFQKLTGTTWATVAGGTDAYVDWNGATENDLANVLIKYYDQTDALALNAGGASYPSATAADFAAATTTKALVAVDARVSSVLPTIVAEAGKAVVSGAVTNAATGAAKAGQVVTFSGSGLLFKSGDVWSIGSATAIANNGTFSVEVYSNNPGTKVVTVTSGTLTKTASLVFTGASSAVRKLTVTAPASVLAGATLSANIELVDGNGNGVETVAPATTPASEYIKVSYDGPGLLSGSLPTATDEDGKATVRYLTGVSDAGSATITVKFDQNFDGDFTDATDIVVVKTVLVGSAAAVSANASVAGIKGFVATTVRNASGKAVTVTVNGRVLTPRAPNVAAQLFRFRATAGKTTVVVKVDGVTVSSRTVSVK